MAEEIFYNTGTNTLMGGMYQQVPDSYWQNYPTPQEQYQRQQQQQVDPDMLERFRQTGLGINETQSDESTLELIKKSIKQIKREAIDDEAQGRVKTKIDRLKKLGATKQSQILEVELSLRIKLAKVQEWDYKVLPYEAIKEYDGKTINTWTMKVHIDILNKYCGVKETVIDEAKDKIIPDFVLDKLEQAKDRQVFDDFSVLWVEKVKDPLLLGSIKGCRDYFFICEWGEDVKFDDIIKKEKK